MKICKDCNKIFSEPCYIQNIIIGNNRHLKPDLVIQGEIFEVCPECNSKNWRYVTENDSQKTNQN